MFLTPGVILTSSVFPISVTNSVLAKRKESADKPSIIPVKYLYQCLFG